MKVTEIVQNIKEHAVCPVTLIAVSKQASIEKMEEVYKAGVRDFGESRLQDALAKKKEMPEDVIWHFIGPIQSNKAKAIATHFDWIHSIASLKVAKIISETSLSLHKKIPCFIEVNISKDPVKQGFIEEELLKILSELQSLEGLDIKGFMTIAPYTKDPQKIRQCFQKLASLQKQFGYPSLSIGMSEDYIIALQEGATHIRVGSYLFSY